MYKVILQIETSWERQQLPPYIMKFAHGVMKFLKAPSCEKIHGVFRNNLFKRAQNRATRRSVATGRLLPIFYPYHTPNTANKVSDAFLALLQVANAHRVPRFWPVET